MNVTSIYFTADQLYPTSKLVRNINIFWTGFLIYTLSYTLSQSTRVNYIACELCQLAGLALLVPAMFSVASFNFDSRYLKCLFILLILWSVTIIARGFNLDLDFLKQMLFNADFGLFLYFVPLVLLFPRKLSFYKKIFTVIVVVDVFYLIYDLIFIKELLNSDYSYLLSQGILEHFAKTLGIPNGFLLLTIMYHSNKRKLLAVFVALVTLFFAMYRARRGLIFISVSIIVFSFLLYFRYSKEKILTGFLALFLVTVVFFNAHRIYPDKKGLFKFLTERLDEDTRSSVETWFYADLTTRDWIIGKGITGKYYYPILDEALSGYRTIIETDYLQLILKGGIINLTLILLIMIPAVIKGLFFSNNLLSKAAGSWILLWILYLFPTSVTTFTLHYILVWMCIGICYSKRMRSIPEEAMKKYFLQVA